MGEMRPRKKTKINENKDDDTFLVEIPPGGDVVDKISWWGRGS